MAWQHVTLSSYLSWRRILDETRDALIPTDILRAVLGLGASTINANIAIKMLIFPALNIFVYYKHQYVL